MARSKLSRLANRPPQHRAEEHTAVNIAGRCRAGDREIQEVHIMDLGAGGCRLLGLSAGVTKSDPLQLWLGEAGPFAGRLRWAKRGLLGVKFDRPLDEGLLESLADIDAGPTVVPMRRSRSD